MSYRLPVVIFVLITGLSGCAKMGDRGSNNPVTGPGTKTRLVKTTAYSHKENEPGAEGRLNAVGTTLRYGKIRSAAADWSFYPVGTQFQIIGKPYIYEIDDYGSALVGTRTLDLFYPTLRQMNDWGSREVEIKITRWGSYQKSANILSKRTQYPHCKEMYRRIQRILR